MTDITDIAKAKREYKDHRSRASRRGIGFELTFSQWCDIWEKSGKYPQRGRRKDQYGMQRFLDLGPYAMGNVEIGSPYENMRTRIVRSSFRQVGPDRNTQHHQWIPVDALLHPPSLSPEEIASEEEEEYSECS